MKKQKSFEEFYYLEINDLADIEVVSDFAEQNKGVITPFENKMFCPECEKAKLTFVNKTVYRKAHLKKIPSSSHCDSCSYIFNYATRSETKSYYDKLTSEQVSDKLDSLMRMLFREKQLNNTFNLNNEKKAISDNPLVIEVEKNNRGTRKSLRRKKLNHVLDKTDGTELMVFWGYVKFEQEEIIKDHNTYYKIKLFTENSEGKWVFRTSIFRGLVRDDVEELKVYKFTAIGNLDFERSEKWPQIKLHSKDAFRYE